MCSGGNWLPNLLRDGENELRSPPAVDIQGRQRANLCIVPLSTDRWFSKRRLPCQPLLSGKIIECDTKHAQILSPIQLATNGLFTTNHMQEEHYYVICDSSSRTFCCHQTMKEQSTCFPTIHGYKHQPQHHHL